MQAVGCILYGTSIGQLQRYTESVAAMYRVCCSDYGVALVSSIDQIISLFCTIASVLEGSFANETYNFIDPTNPSHPI